MLTLQLTLDNRQVTVIANERHSHTFSLYDLNVDLKNFVKDPRPYGGKLFQALFKDGSEARKAFDELSKKTERTIVLVLESSELDGIAWEYAYHDNAYIVEDFAFIRALPERERPHSNGRLSKSVERVPLLFIPANPLVDLSGEPMHELDIESEWREMIQHIVKSNAPLDLVELRPATPSALQSVMARFQNGIIAHFSGHGAATKNGAFLLFENENGSSNPLEAREFVREVKDQAWIGFLSSCQSAVAERTEYSNLARKLVKAGVPFALGMQFNLPDSFAPNISGQFYNYLSQGHAVPEAARQARRAVKRENEFFVGMIALYAAHPDEAGKMGWTGSGVRTLPTFAAADVSDLPTPSGFIGRQRELMQIGTQLLSKKKPNTVTLHGAGGIGKTALMRQVLLRFAPSFESGLAIVLDPLPSLESVLGRIERFLNLPSPCTNENKEREQIIRERLTSKHTLLGLDNFETLNYALNEEGSDEEKTAKSLHSFFKNLVANGVTLCVTSREVTNLGGEFIIDIEGLPNDVGGRLFQANVVTQKGEIYIEKTQQVSKMVGGHPLALRLLASAFDDQVEMSLDQYIEDLQSHLPKARDKWTEEDRHKSLRASFDFTLNNLTNNDQGQRLTKTLIHLSVFLSFFEDIIIEPLLKRLEFEKNNDQDDKDKTESGLYLLWKHGLLERINIGIDDKNHTFYLYRIHPALRILTRERVGENEEENIKLGYLSAMGTLLQISEELFDKNTLVSRMVLYSIPDLVSVSGSDIEKNAAAQLQFRVSKLLIRFGHFKEALRLLEKSLAANNLLKIPEGVSTCMIAIADIYKTQGDINKALSLYQDALEISRNANDLARQAMAQRQLAEIYIIQGDFVNASKLSEQSLEIFKSLKEHESMAGIWAQLAHIYTNTGEFDKALKLYRQSSEYYEKQGNVIRQSVINHQMSIIYRLQGNLDEALKLLQQSLDISKDARDMLGVAATFHEIANIHVIQKNHIKALNLYGQAFEIFSSIGDLIGASMVVSMMGRAFWEIGNRKKAIVCVNTGLRTLASLKSMPAEQQKMAAVLTQWREHIGSDEFDLLWREGLNEPTPNWLKNPVKIKIDTQFVSNAIRSRFRKNSDLAEYLKTAQLLATDDTVPKETREIGRVLSMILAGNTDVDLSGLSYELMELIRKELGQ